MPVDGTIASPIGGASVLVTYVIVMWRLSPKRPKQYNRPEKVAVVTPFNLFDDKRWTKDGIDYHRRLLQFGPVALLVFVATWLIADAVW